MVPTIDLSLIGIILAIWQVVKVIWDYTSKALNWITQRALSIFIGSKFWATAAFLSTALVLVALFSSIISSVVNALSSLVGSSLTPDNSVLGFVFLYIPADDLIDCFSTGFSCIVTYVSIVNLDFARRGVLHFFNLLSRSWKT